MASVNCEIFKFFDESIDFRTVVDFTKISRAGPYKDPNFQTYKEMCE